MNCSCCGMDFTYRKVGSALLCDSCFEEFASDFRPGSDSAATDYIDGPNLSPAPHSLRLDMHPRVVPGDASQPTAGAGESFRGSRSPLLGGSPTPFPAAPESFNEGDMSD